VNVIVRLTRGFFDEVRSDLRRPHACAAERLGFVLCKWTASQKEIVVYPLHYLPIQDEHYVDAPSVGAQIDSSAIRAALQATLDRRAACLHVHLHPPRMPYFSDLDLEEQDKLIPSFAAINPAAPHGAIVMWGDGSASARVWPPGSRTSVMATRVSVIGYPMALSGDNT
jgi:hypothetical protein